MKNSENSMTTLNSIRVNIKGSHYTVKHCSISIEEVRVIDWFFLISCLRNKGRYKQVVHHNEHESTSTYQHLLGGNQQFRQLLNHKHYEYKSHPRR
jgi:hypothetical protein